MSRSTRLLQDTDLAAVTDLLQRAFEGISGGVANAVALRWKYLQPGPLWDGPRAFLVEQDGKIVAHSGFVPAVFLSPDMAPIASLVATDWAADPDVPGVGVAVYAHVIRRVETAFLIGGVDVTRSIVPKLGFRPFAEATIYSRWIRPWREFWTRSKSVRAVQRLGHGLLDRIRTGSPRPGSWTATRVSEFDGRIDPVLDFRPRRRTIFQRTRASLNHMLACPIARMQGYVLDDGSGVRGYVIFAFLGWEARLVDINIDSEERVDWTSAYAAATVAAGLEPDVCRVRAMTAAPEQAAALRENGFWVNSAEPVMLYAPKGRTPNLPIDIQFFESDLSYV